MVDLLVLEAVVFKGQIKRKRLRWNRIGKKLRLP